MSIFYYADSHFGHGNIIKLDGRPFTSVDEMDRMLIENYNKEVTDEDDVYIDGDLIYESNKSPQYYLEQLKGKKHLVLGNHDRWLFKDPSIRKHFVEIDKTMFINDGNERVVISHCPFAEWEGYFRGVYHVYAHIHNNLNDTYYFMKTKERALNAGCMINNYKPVTLKELIANNNEFRRTH